MPSFEIIANYAGGEYQNKAALRRLLENNYSKLRGGEYQNIIIVRVKITAIIANYAGGMYGSYSNPQEKGRLVNYANHGDGKNLCQAAICSRSFSVIPV